MPSHVSPPRALVITGASGCIGRHVVLALCDRFHLYCLARRSQKEAEIQHSPNIHWIQADIADQKEMHRASEFTPPGQVVDESTPVSAEFPYARSKRQAEEILSKHKKNLQTCIVRLGAVYSDWCEFPPIYSLLETWLSHSPLSMSSIVLPAAWRVYVEILYLKLLWTF